jgi:hypothetical protein
MAELPKKKHPASSAFLFDGREGFHASSMGRRVQGGGESTGEWNVLLEVLRPIEEA